MGYFKPASPEAYRLLHEGAIALSAIEENGFAIDVGRLDQEITQARGRIKAMEEELWSTDIGKAWRKQFGNQANLGSRDEMAHTLFRVLGYNHPAGQQPPSKGQSWKMDEYVLEDLNLPFCDRYMELEGQKKLLKTYLLGVRSEVVDGLLHAFVNLNTVETYRSSSSDPNLQNLPIRDPIMGGPIRRCFIPRHRRHKIIEIDMVGAEVRVAAAYHLDPTMLKYIIDGYDMHRDMAAECYMLPRDAVPKAVRQQAKALFVFAQFYGDYYLSCADSLWDAIKRHKLVGNDGASLYEHLRAQGIRELGTCYANSRDGGKAGNPRPGTFEHHIKKVEDRFWGQRFPVYDQWRRDWWDAYCRNGGFHTHTGFAVHGVYSRNQVINSPVQGSAFHCLLWVMIEANKELHRRKMRSRITMQIHDSIVGDVHEDEQDEYIGIVTTLMRKTLPETWDWIATPLEVEVEASEAGGSWHDKKPLVETAGGWKNKQAA